MSVEVIEVSQRANEGVNVAAAPFTALGPELGSSTSSSSESDSDGGYGTPAENFADDELHADEVRRAPSPVAEPHARDGNVEVVVDPELRDRITKQVEWYFSDENLLKDSFLMKHINRNKQGYVSLKLVASFRKVKSLTKDWRVVLVSVKHSSLLSLSEDETKIRRLAPAPQVDYSHASRTVIVTSYPTSEPYVNMIETQFGQFGEVTLVRILHPGKAIPLDVKPSRSRHPSLGKELCILVEYESENGAKVACERFNNQQNWRDEMKVQLLSGGKEQSHKHSQTQEPEKTAKITAPIDAGWKTKRRQQNDQRKQMTRQRRNVKEGSPIRDTSPMPRNFREGSPIYSRAGHKKTADVSPAFQDRRRYNNKPGSPELSRQYLHTEQSWRDCSSDSACSSRSPSQSPKSSPEPSKKFHYSSLGEAGGAWRKHVNHRDSCVVRQPLGPDGSRGFSRIRQPIKISIESC